MSRFVRPYTVVDAGILRREGQIGNLGTDECSIFCVQENAPPSFHWVVHIDDPTELRSCCGHYYNLSFSIQPILCFCND